MFQPRIIIVFKPVNRWTGSMVENAVIGATVGDIIGSAFEWSNTETSDSELFRPGALGRLLALLPT